MRINSEKVKQVQSEIDVTYEEAEKYLRRARGDVELAIHLIRLSRETTFHRFIEEATRILKEFMVYRVIIRKEQEVFINIPLLLMIIVFWVIDWNNTLFIFIVATGFVLMTNSDITIKRVVSDNEERESETKARVVNEQKKQANNSDKDIEVNSQSVENANKDSAISGHVNMNEQSKENDDYYEITIDK